MTLALFTSPAWWFVLAGIWGSCSLLCLLIGYQEYRAFRGPVTEVEAAANSRPLTSAIENGVTR